MSARESDEPERPPGWNEALAAAAELGAGDWQLDAEPDADPPQGETPSTPPPVPAAPIARLFPKVVAEPEEPPPSPLQIVEAMLFIGGPPLTAEKACSAIRGLTAERFRELVDELARSYRKQNRPYAVQPRDAGWILALRSQFRGVQEKLFGGPKETRLTQPAIDVLGLIAYRQPVGKAELDTGRGADSGHVLRQLVRLGLIASARGAAGYETTPRFLEVFGLRTLDDLPRLAEGKM